MTHISARRGMKRATSAAILLGAAALAPAFASTAPASAAPPPTLTISNPRVTEGNSGTVDLVLPVNLTGTPWKPGPTTTPKPPPSSTTTPPPPPPSTTTPPPPATTNLQIWIDGWGAGTVTSSPAGINCHQGPAINPYESNQTQSQSGTCLASFPVGTVVTVTATADPGSDVNYLDCGGATGNPCKRTVTSGYNAATAMFCPTDGLCSAG